MGMMPPCEIAIFLNAGTDKSKCTPGVYPLLGFSQLGGDRFVAVTMTEVDPPP